MFDKLLLTAQGRLMYLGDASKAVPWFESLGFSYGTNSSEADWVIDLVTTDFDKDETIFGSHSIRNTDDLMRSSKAFIGSDAFRGAMQRGQLSALTRQLNVAASVRSAGEKTKIVGKLVYWCNRSRYPSY